MRTVSILATFVVLGIAVVICYLPGVSGPFLMDDFDAIHAMFAGQDGNLDLWTSLSNAPHHIRDRWVSNFSFLLTHLASGQPDAPSAFAFKLGNLIVHLASAAAVAAMAHALAARWNVPRSRLIWISALAAALFALHPLLLSTVLYPVQRMSQLATLFAVLAVLSYVHWRASYDRLSTLANAAGIAIVSVFTLLSVLSKESGALTPVLIGVVEITAFAWPARESSGRSRFDTGFGLTCAGPLVLGGILVLVRWADLTAGYAARDFTLTTRLLTEIHVVSDYLFHIFVPRISDLGLYRDDFPRTTSLDLPTSLLILGYLVLVLGAILLRRRWPAGSLGVLWFLGAHALESTFIPLELVFEHRNYLALAGPAIGVAWLLCSIRPRWLAAVASLGIATLLGAQTWNRAQDWSNYERWIEAEARHHPKSLRAGTDLFSWQVAAGRTDAAIATRERLTAAHPEHAQPLILKLAFACEGPIPIPAYSEIELARLSTATIDKDSFHTFVGLRDQLLRSRCEQPQWYVFAAASSAIARNPLVLKHAKANAAWWRLAADAHRRSWNWNGVRTSIEQALMIDPADPRDWLLLAEAAAVEGDRATYLRARQAAIDLLGPRRSLIESEIERIDRMAGSAR